MTAYVAADIDEMANESCMVLHACHHVTRSYQNLTQGKGNLKIPVTLLPSTSAINFLIQRDRGSVSQTNPLSERFARYESSSTVSLASVR